MAGDTEFNDLCKTAVYSNEYADFIDDFNLSEEEIKKLYNAECIRYVSQRYILAYAKRTTDDFVNLQRFEYRSIPKLYGVMDTSNMESSGVLKIRRQPYLDLLGQDTIVGIIDVGIDYQNPLFIQADGTSRIMTIWDQTVEDGTPPDGFIYGAEYKREQINEALKSEQPEQIVPTTDVNGHGTFMTAIAAGNEDRANDFTGVVPLADIAVVRLKQAKPYLKEFFAMEQSDEAYQENDIMLGVKYLLTIADSVKKPISICIGLGTNQGDHNGNSPLSSYLNIISNTTGICITTAAGNEANIGVHYQGSAPINGYEEVEITVSEAQKGFSLELWGDTLSSYAVSFISPSGEVSERIPPKVSASDTVKFLLEPTTIDVDYRGIEVGSGDQLILMRFRNLIAGIWKVRIYNESIFQANYNMWLPIGNYVSEGTFFLKPEPFITLVETGTTKLPISVATYDHINDSIYVKSSKGYTREGAIKPDLAAPGVNVYGPVTRRTFGRRSGSSIAAAHVAGSAAIFLQWGIVNGNRPKMSTSDIRILLIRGAKRSKILYPNRDWGYGRLDLFASFETLKSTL